ncbi:NEAT domain-containing protein [Staphylococcus massiliensis]|uniref:Putative surface protein n=1 Tax=Staphylococcus massiliensis S46 TaxID=1229783 RepID=K9B5M9_9STAP|nr:NEAT domain-containing protein [Staphylococcus massiliensis]EKU50137.1 putative surface protein [Staphylococcus massiliensis S46]MCG3400443.1 NEAT domain-containing protein [Staphylococcus massiliensis]MCG3402160.1 NEAT domain-containing protein [Staphylococcus massiliensis]MCG3412873.1 NEAT domain-containing protein [Staphylococcus massiliensis]POA00831.1 surface protein [Staphylococcus massiliensis CCUG 55927]
MKRIFKIILIPFLLLTVITDYAHAETTKELQFEVLKEGSEEVAIANEYFEKPAKVIERDGKSFIRFDINHSHWIKSILIDGQKETVIKEDKTKDTRVSEFLLSQTSGKVKGVVKVEVDEKVNGSPFKYDHEYKVEFNLKGDVAASTDKATTSSTPEKVEPNPKTFAGEPVAYEKFIIVALIGIVITFFISRKRKTHHVS